MADVKLGRRANLVACGLWLVASPERHTDAALIKGLRGFFDGAALTLVAFPQKPKKG